MSTPKLFQNLFLSVGAMKAGTTWLYSVLDRHPELHFAKEKELHYFYHHYVNPRMLSEAYRLRSTQSRYLPKFDPEQANIDAIRENLRWVSAYLSRPVDDYWYRSLFQMRDHQTYACDFSNLNAQIPADVWPQIVDKCERLRVMFVMRDPVARLWSHTRFHLQVIGQLDKLTTWGPKQFNDFMRRPHMWVNTEYGTILRNLQEGLAPEMLKVMFYEDIHQDQRGSLRGIEEFLGVAPFDYPQTALDRRVTESVKHPMPEFFPSLVADDVARICDEVEAAGYTLPAKWRRFEKAAA